MAGIGFELRKLLKKRSYAGLLQAYFYAGVIGSGPWILSIVGIIVIGILSLGVVIPDILITEFQVTVTYLIMASLILTGLVQLAFTRFVADRLFIRDEDAILPNFNGLLLVVCALAALVSLPLAFFFFPGQTALYRSLLIMGLAVMSSIWVATIFLTGLKHYKAIVVIFAFGYGATVLLALALRRWLQMEGLLLGFVLGQFALLVGMLWLIHRNYRSPRLVAFDIWRKKAMYRSLMITGLLINLGVWIDKLMFWYHPATGHPVIGLLQASVIYDFPIFLAYLSIIPGMAVFLVRLETDFVEYYSKFFDAVREGATLDYIERMRNQMVYYARRGLFDIAKIQGIAVMVTMLLGADLLHWLGISTLYLPLLYVDVVGAALQVLFLGIANILFYLDERKAVLGLCATLVLGNVSLTALSIAWGAAWFGYGFAGAMALVVVIGLALLDRKFEKLEYKTFMLQ